MALAQRSNMRCLMVIMLLCSVLAPAVTCARAARNKLSPANTTSSKACSFSPIFAFGDSTTDTGNQVLTKTPLATAASPPYGTTFFKKPTGRYSDGRLMVDFLTSALKVDALPPHLARVANSANENFAVAGATALDLEKLQQIANITSFTPDSLSVQMSWFQKDISESAGVDLSKALVYFGEIGGNDYNYALAANRPPNQVAALLPAVMDTISSSLHVLLSKGIKNIIVQGQFPMGCLALYLKVLNGTKADKNGCIESVMQISDQHNILLREVVANATKVHPKANIIFFDSSAAYLHILQNAAQYNFTNVRDPCYTGGLALLASGPSHLTASSSNLPQPPLPQIDTKACLNPRNYISWDGIHLTDAMYGTMMNLFLSDSKYTSPFPNSLIPCTKR